MLTPQRDRRQIPRHRLDGHIADPDRLPRVGDPRRRHDPLVGFGLAQIPHRAMQCGEAEHAVGGDDGFGEEHGVLVVEEVQVDVERVVVGEEHRPEAPPFAKVGRHRERRAGAERSVRDVRHDEEPQVAHPCDARVLDAGIADTVLPRSIRLEHDALPLDADRHAARHDDAHESDAGHISRRDQARQQVHLPIRAAAGRWIEDPFQFVEVAVLRRHDHSDSRERVRDGRQPSLDRGHPFTPDPRSELLKWRWNRMNSTDGGIASTTAPARIVPRGCSSMPPPSRCSWRATPRGAAATPPW